MSSKIYLFKLKQHSFKFTTVFTTKLVIFTTYYKVQALWAPSGTNHKAKLAISLSRWLGRYTNVEYLNSLYLKRRGQLQSQSLYLKRRGQLQFQVGAVIT